MELYSNSKNIIKNKNYNTKSKIVITPNIHDIYNTENNIYKEKQDDDILKDIRVKKFKFRRDEILKFKKISEMLILRGKREAAKILKESMDNAQIEIIRMKVASKVQGYKEGYEEGKRKSIEEIEAQKDELINNAMMFYENAQLEVKEYIAAKELEIQEMIFNMVSKIIKRQLSNEKILIDIIYDSLKNIRDKLPVVVKCSEYNYQFLNNEIGKLKDTAGVLGDFHVVISKDINQGEFILERNGGIIKYSIEDNLENLRKIIFNEGG